MGKDYFNLSSILIISIKFGRRSSLICFLQVKAVIIIGNNVTKIIIAQRVNKSQQ